jgi:hypothetical protein
MSHALALFCGSRNYGEPIKLRTTVVYLATFRAERLIVVWIFHLNAEVTSCELIDNY